MEIITHQEISKRFQDAKTLAAVMKERKEIDNMIFKCRSRLNLLEANVIHCLDEIALNRRNQIRNENE